MLRYYVVIDYESMTSIKYLRKLSLIRIKLSRDVVIIGEFVRFKYSEDIVITNDIVETKLSRDTNIINSII